MPDGFDTIDRISELLVHLGRASRTEDSHADLTTAQWTCLRFFARANASTRTPSAFAGFQATTRGTASQIIKTLEGRGLIARHRSLSDGRSVRFDLTGPGRTLLSRDPLRELNGLLGAFDAAESEAFLATLSRLATSLADLKNKSAFGTCQDCIYFTPVGGGGVCTCMAADLGSDEVNKLCGSYRGSAGSTPRLQTTRTYP
jgi:DNA-binding MarR family transcriptional regulator